MVAPEMPEPFRVSVDSTKVDYVRLGKSGLKVSVPILGAMSVGDPGWGSWIIGEEKVDNFRLLSNGLESVSLRRTSF